MWPYTWPHALQKAQAAARKIEHTVQRLGLRLDATRTDIVEAPVPQEAAA